MNPIKTVTVPVRILTVNDVYADFPVRGIGGYTTLGTLLKKYRVCSHENVIATINGDFLGGASIAETFKGKHIIEVLNTLKMDYAVLGNHEFDYGPEELKHRIAESKFKWLGSNVYETIEGQQPHMIEGVHEILVHKIPVLDPESSEILCEMKIGLFGICTRHTPDLSYPGPTIKFEAPLPTADRCLQLLKEKKVDLYMALTHVTLPTDIQLAKNSPSLELILGGHDHDAHGTCVGETLIFKTGQNAYWLGVVDLEFHLDLGKNDQGYYIENHKTFKSWSMVSVRGEPDQEILKIMEYYTAEHEKIRADQISSDKELLSFLEEPLDTRSHQVRSMETSSGNLLADALHDFYREDKADMGFINGGFIRGDKIYPKGHQLSASDLYFELPFPRNSVLVEIKGKHLKAAVNKALSKPTPSGAFLHFSKGVKVTYRSQMPGHNNENQEEEVLVDMTFNGNQIDDEKFYRVVITEFMARGGDGIHPWLEGKIVVDRGSLTRDIFRCYLRKNPTICPSIEGRVTVLQPKDSHGN